MSIEKLKRSFSEGYELLGKFISDDNNFVDLENIVKSSRSGLRFRKKGGDLRERRIDDRCHAILLKNLRAGSDSDRKALPALALSRSFTYHMCSERLRFR